MLNLSHLQTQVKSVDFTDVRLNTANPPAMNQAYKILKSLGWASGQNAYQPEMHPTDRVPVFRLGPASIRRDKRTGGWVLEQAEGELLLGRLSANDLARLTDEVKTQIDARTLKAYDLVDQVQANGSGHTFSVGKYHIDLEAGTCTCPDHQYRQVECKHIRAARLARQEQTEFEAAAARKQADRIERHRGQGSIPADAPLSREERVELDDLRRSEHTYRSVPGDGGISDQDLDAPLPAETYRQLCQEQINAGDWSDLDRSLATMEATLSRLDPPARRHMQAAIDWAVKWSESTRPAATVGDDIKRRPGQEESQETDAVRPITDEERERGYAHALGNQQRGFDTPFAGSARMNGFHRWRS